MLIHIHLHTHSCSHPYIHIHTFILTYSHTFTHRHTLSKVVGTWITSWLCIHFFFDSITNLGGHGLKKFSAMHETRPNQQCDSCREFRYSAHSSNQWKDFEVTRMMTVTMSCEYECVYMYVWVWAWVCVYVYMYVHTCMSCVCVYVYKLHLNDPPWYSLGASLPIRARSASS